MLFNLSGTIATFQFIILLLDLKIKKKIFNVSLSALDFS